MTAPAAGISYVLPLRWTEEGEIAELAAYLRSVAEVAREVVVVDGSPPALYRRHAALLGSFCRHIAPRPDLRFAMGKVNGVITGVHASRCERVIIADDDVRYDAASLRRTAALLDGAELVRPQNFFRPPPWHARWDTARTLLNRVASGDLDQGAADFPGTLAARRSFFVEIGAYDGNVIFENLELIRTVRAAGGRVVSPLDLYVERRPPSARHFLSQRVRQAYDDFALPLRMATFLAIGPALVTALVRRRYDAVAGGALALIAIAEAGRRRSGGRAVFPATASLFAPAWALERAVTSWIALGHRLLRGGVPYAGGVVPRSASSMRELRARYSARRAAAAEGPPRPDSPLAASKPIPL